MGRSPSRTSNNSADPATERAEVRLLKAVEDCNLAETIAIIEQAKAKAQPCDHLFRIGLARATERGHISIAEFLLVHGPKLDAAGNGRANPLMKAVEKNNLGMVTLILKHGGDPNVADKQGRTALMTAAWRNHFHILQELLRRGADVNKRDNAKRNVLHNLAADKHNNWGRDVIDLLLKTNVAVDGEEGQDVLKRSPLHWAAVTGKKELCEWLLLRPRSPRANVNATEVREKTPLHLAVAHGRDDIVELLLHYGADVKARSDGGWTALHNACEQPNVMVVKQLLAAGSELNAKLLNGMTPLHVAAQAGHLDVVNCLMERKDLKRAARDAFGITPFLRAAQSKRKDIVNVLAPFNHVDSLSDDALGACNGFNATIVDFGDFHNENKVVRRTVFELLYGRDSVNKRKPAITVLPKDSKATRFRWIHLPANNMAWVETLLTKAFIEEGASDVEGFKALERSFNHQHRGQQIHSHFMRPLCQSTPRAPKIVDDSEFSDGDPPQITVTNITNISGLGINSTTGAQEHIIPKAPKRNDTISTDATDWTVGTAGTAGSASGKDRKESKGKEKYKKTAKGGGNPKPGSGKQGPGKSSGTDTPTKHSDHHARQRKVSHSMHDSMRDSGHLRSPGSPGRKDPTQTAKGNIFAFMPYLHFETDRSRQEMQAAIFRAQALKEREKNDGRIVKPALHKAKTYDEMLLRAHLTSSTVSLHVRRTLDQFFYHNIDTQSRDQDQVVYRYQCRKMDDTNSHDPKIFMVDQLWMWILGKDTIVTSFPQRWQQPKNDPLNVLDGIIEDINSKTREPVRSVYDLALIITSRCSGMFDRHRMGDEEYQFLDMFESSIGDATDRETKLFKEFDSASAQASQWLQHHRKPERFSRHLEAEGRVLEHQNKHHVAPHSHAHTMLEPPTKENDYLYHDDGPIHAPLFVDKLLDIGAETALLAETKDIRDELNMITKVLEDQRSVLPDLEVSILDIYREEHKSQQELKKRFREQLKTIDVHLKDIDRMDKQAERIYKSITDLLDLKQKHANAFEARFARDQAAGTARQSQTIMVFTIVTIIFLPLSFIAALFTINIREFPHQGDNPSLPLAYVSKFMFGVGFAISIPLIAIAVSIDAIGDTYRYYKKRWVDWRSARAQQKKNGLGAPVQGRMANEKMSLDISYDVDIHALERALSAGRSTMRVGHGRHSLDGRGASMSYLSRPSADTRRAGSKEEVQFMSAEVNGNRSVLEGRLDGRETRPQPVERMSTGFRIRRSHDVERGL